MNPIPYFEAQISELQHQIDELNQQLVPLRARLARAKHGLRQAGVRMRQASTLARECEWEALVENDSLRWTDKWWASDGWHLLADHVMWDGPQDYALMIAIFAELEPREQYVLEHWYGLGYRKKTLKQLGILLPRADFKAYGVSHTRARELIWRSVRRLRSKYRKALEDRHGRQG